MTVGELGEATLPRLGAEEVANSVTHGIGAALSVAGLVLLVVFAALRGTAWHVVGCSIHGTTLVLLFNCSALYHLARRERAKRFFRALDHVAIFLLIAGTYTPFLLTTLRGAWGWTLFGLIWGLCVLGTGCELLDARRFRVVSVPLYLAMGWLVLIAGRPLAQALARPGLVLLVAGGLCYTLGVPFYALHRVPFAHAVWHVFVLAGSVCHWFCVLLYVIPRG